MATPANDPVLNVALSRSQIYELLAHTNMGNHSTPGLVEARKILRNMVRPIDQAAMEQRRKEAS